MGALVALALLASSGPAAAWEVELRVGLEGVLREQGWAPLTVVCRSSREDPPLEGRVVVDLAREAVGSAWAPIALAPGAVATTHLVVPAAPGRSYEARLLDAEGRMVATSTPEVALSLLEPDEPLVLLVGGERLSALRAWSQKGDPRLARVSPAELRQLPECVLDGLAALVLSPDGSAELRDLARDREQVELLRAWVERGGTLVVLAGSGAPFWADSPLLELLPVRGSVGVVDAPRAVFEAVLGPLGALDAQPESFPVLAVIPRQAERVFPGSDLLLQRRLGRGRVLFLTFDPDLPSLRSAVRAGPFLAQLTPPRPLPPIQLRDETLEGLSRRAFHGVGSIGTTGVTLVALALLVQILLVGPVVLLLTRRRGPWVGFFAPAACSLLVAAALFLGGAVSRGDPAARALVWSFHDGRGSGPQRVSLGLYAGAGEQFRLELEPGTVPEPGARRDLGLLQLRRPPAQLLCQEGQPVAIDGVWVPARGLADLELAAPPSREPAPFQARLLPPAGSGGFPLVELEARAPVSGLLALVIGPRESRLGRIPDLTPGAHWTFDPEQAMALPEERGAWEGDLWSDPSRSEEALLIALAAQLQAERFRASAATQPAGLPPLFPSTWLLRVDTPAHAPLRVRRPDADGAELPVAIRRVSVWAVEALR